MLLLAVAFIASPDLVSAPFLIATQPLEPVATSLQTAGLKLYYASLLILDPFLLNFPITLLVGSILYLCF